MNYKNLLYEIQKVNSLGPTADQLTIPKEAQLYEVDLNSRTIKAPNFLSVESEHKAQTIYFLVDRYYGNMDLAQTNCIIQYKTNTDEDYIYAVPYGDTVSIEGKIIIPWTISLAATKNAGEIKYVIRFYLVDVNWDTNQEPAEDTARFIYSLSTLPASSKILKSFSLDKVIEDADYQLETENRYFELINTVTQIADNATTYWIDV